MRAPLVFLGALVVILVLTPSVSGVPATAMPSGAKPTASAATVSVTSPGMPAYMQMASVSVQRGSSFHFVMVVEGTIPSHPALAGYPLLDWQVAIDTNQSTAPVGWPRGVTTAAPPEYLVDLWWDGHIFAATVADRTPLLSGGTASITPIGFGIHGARISFDVSASSIGSPSSFGFFGFASFWSTAVVSIASPHSITIGPGDDFPVDWTNSAPFYNPAGQGFGYTDSYGYDLGATGIGTDAWAGWSAAVNGHTAAVASGTPGWIEGAWTKVTGGGGSIGIEEKLQAPIPASPALLGNQEILWVLGLDTNNSTAPPGYPFHIGPDPSDYILGLWWDGTNFAATLINRTPILTGHADIVTPVSFSLRNSAIDFSLRSAMLGNPSSIGFVTINVYLEASLMLIRSPTHVQAVYAPLLVSDAPSYVTFPPNCSYVDPLLGDCWTLWP